jgi:hypothetical protein
MGWLVSVNTYTSIYVSNELVIMHFRNAAFQICSEITLLNRKYCDQERQVNMLPGLYMNISLTVIKIT